MTDPQGPVDDNNDWQRQVAPMLAVVYPLQGVPIDKPLPWPPISIFLVNQSEMH